jgi:hypothetical protein
MEIVVNRFSSGLESTLGLMTVDGRFACYTLEDQFNEPKVFGETRIPPGRYRIDVRTEGSMYPRYKARFSPWHQGMLWLRNVPNFKYVYIHVGNKDDDTDGCILVGDGQMSNLVERGQVTASVSAYKRLYPQVLNAIMDGEEVFITVMES